MVPLIMTSTAPLGDTTTQLPVDTPPPSVLTSLKNSFANTSQDQSMPSPVSDISQTQPVLSAPASPQNTGNAPLQADPLQSVAQVVPAVIQSGTDTLNPAHAVSGTTKEVREPGVTLEKPAIDQVPGIQHVEHEKAAEMSPEVEAFIQKVDTHPDQLPQEIVIADQQGPVIPPTKYLAKPVIILPITPEVEKDGKFKNSQFSVRWLVEWSHKVMKMFSGKVIYRQPS